MLEGNAILTAFASLGFSIYTVLPLIFWPIRYVSMFRIALAFVSFSVAGVVNYLVASSFDYPTTIHYGFAALSFVYLVLVVGTAWKRLNWSIDLALSTLFY